MEAMNKKEDPEKHRFADVAAIGKNFNKLKKNRGVRRRSSGMSKFERR